MKQILKWIKDKAWWREWAVAFWATVCGIVVTLGTDAWVQRCDQKAKARRVVEISMISLHDYFSAMEDNLEQVSQRDSLFRVVRAEYDGDSLDVSTCVQFINALGQKNVTRENSDSEDVFNSSLEIWLTLDAPSEIETLGNAFANNKTFKSLFDEDQTIRRGLYKKHITQNWDQLKVSVIDAVEEMLDDPELQLYMIEHNLTQQVLEALRDEQASQLSFLRESLGLSLDDMKTLRTEYHSEPPTSFHTQ
ncbi:MAG: hypothetical protein LIP09_07500 [Bacteroidales bacterium]|nr:hypothetical protein [Bacteroidales bacterium]